MKVVIEADGGARGNPGPAGYGSVVLDSTGQQVLAERYGGLGHTTNNVAEYTGLIEGLRAAVELGATSATVRMDSKLVVEQMSGRWKIKQPHLQPLALEASKLAREIGDVRYEWIGRAFNQRADRLANLAMDEQAGKPPGKKAAARTETTAQTAPPATWLGASGTAATRLLLVRHGQTDLSAQRRYSGRGDPALTDLGERQAAAVAKRLSSTPDVAAVITSPLQRARRTAEHVAGPLGLRPRVHEGLIETDFGAWEGMTFADARERDPDLHGRWITDTSTASPGGESMDQVHERVGEALGEILAEHGGSTLVLVSHVTPIKSVLRTALAAGPTILYRLHLDLASVSEATFYPDGLASVRLFNDISHLDGL